MTPAPANTSQESRVAILRDRARMLAKARAFFSERNVLEVDCPALSHASAIDTHIDVMKVDFPNGDRGYLHTSPEYGMKRLLAEGIGDIYQISHVFREGEIGPLHNPEFTMVEWYRLALSFEELIQETVEFTKLFLNDLSSETFSYQQLFLKFVDLDPFDCSLDDLQACAKKFGLHLSSQMENTDRDTLLQLILSFLIEPKLKGETLFVVRDFPASQAALSQVRGHVAMRFEIYYQGIELANGYHELIDAVEQRRRFEKNNQERSTLGKALLPIDEHLLQALHSGLPDCCGVAVGFDRLMLLRHHAETLHTILPFSWQNA